MLDFRVKVYTTTTSDDVCMSYLGSGLGVCGTACPTLLDIHKRKCHINFWRDVRACFEILFPRSNFSLRDILCHIIIFLTSFKWVLVTEPISILGCTVKRKTTLGITKMLYTLYLFSNNHWIKEYFGRFLGLWTSSVIFACTFGPLFWYILRHFCVNIVGGSKSTQNHLSLLRWRWR